MKAIDSTKLKALEVIHKKLDSKKINWVIGGSLALVLSGVKINKIKDIDIFSTKEDAYLVGQQLEEYVIEPVKFRLSKEKNIKSHYGIFNINNIKVEVIGEFSLLNNNEWHVVCLNKEGSKKFVNFKNMDIPILSLEESLIYHKLSPYKKHKLRINNIKKMIYYE